MDDSHIPIDINTNKLLDWLVSRRHVSKDWQANILKIREKINAAIQDMPAHDGIVKLLSGQHINYFHCIKIIEILKETEADTKNLFGRYGSQRMKDWQDIVSCYQQENIYLAEASQLMMRNVIYEVPGLKKQIAKCEQAQQESEKKIKDYSRAETIAINDFNATCKQLGIKGKNIKAELLELLKELPLIYKKMDFKELQDGINMYKSFINYHSGKNDNLPLLPILSYLISHGNTTTYEYTYGEKPVSVEEPTSDATLTTDKEESANIDFGDDVQIDFSSLSVEKEIDFGDSPGDSPNEGDIDWGNTSTTEEEFEIVDIDINLEESGIVVENSGLDGGIAKGNDAYTILDNPKTRDQIINDLMELNAFLKMRLYEMANGGDMMTMLDGPNVLKMQTIEGVTSLADHVSIALEGLMNKRIFHLHNIKHSPKYVDMLTASLKQKLDVVDRMKASKTLVEDKMVDNAAQIKKINPVIKQVIDKTKILQKQIEEDISKKYKGRVVNIVGAINLM